MRYTRMTRVLGAFRGSVLRILPDSQCFGVRYVLWVLFVQVFRGSVLRVLQVITVSRPLVILILSICLVYSEYEAYFDHRCTPCRQFRAHCSAESMCRWSHEWELEQITFGRGKWSTFEYWQYFGGMYRECSRHFEALY